MDEILLRNALYDMEEVWLNAIPGMTSKREGLYEVQARHHHSSG